MAKTDITDAERDALEERKRDSVGQLLFKASRLLNERAVTRVQAAGATGFRLSHTRLLPHLDFEGTRITTLAERAGVSKQAVAKMVDELEAQGVVRRVPDPEDGRAKLVRFTKSGLAGMHQGLSVLAELEGELEEAVGARAVKKLKKRLASLIEWLEQG